MRKISVSDARTHFYRLLDDVERGETILITRNGRVIARIGPEPSGESALETQEGLSATGS
jgi:prevent-host-death family protein